MINQAQLKELLHYDPGTGDFTRLKTTAALGRAGNKAGTLKAHGYIAISLGSREHYAHRLAWLYVHGTWPDRKVDHINGNKADNRIRNLRLATDSENAFNVTQPRVNNKTGFLGVVFDKARGKYVAYLRVDGRNRNLGGFDTAEKAHQRYLQAKREHHAIAEA